MKNEKTLIVTIGIILGVLSPLARLCTFGFFYLIGLLSAVLFGIIHIIFLIELSQFYNKEKLLIKILAWIGVLAYPFIFLFQFDLEEFKDSFYVYEFLTGTHQSNFENYAFYIAIFFACIYFINFIIFNVKIASFNKGNN